MDGTLVDWLHTTVPGALSQKLMDFALLWFGSWCDAPERLIHT